MIGFALAVTIATTRPTDHLIYLVGAGQMSCGDWIAHSPNHKDMATWVLGYWSGLNTALTRKVGYTTDANGILGEVNKECAAHPSERLFLAVDAVYQRLGTSSR
jgi:hypothetical protein